MDLSSIPETAPRRLGRETVLVIAQHAAPGYSIQPRVSDAIAADAEYRLRQVIQEACKFMRHSKRSTLTSDDLQASMRVLNIDSLWGIMAREPLKLTPVHTASGLYYIPDREVSLNLAVKKELPVFPHPVNMVMHWLAVEGVQPAIPQNPAPQELAALEASFTETETRSGKGFKSFDAQAQAQAQELIMIPAPKKAKISPAENVEIKPLMKHVLSREAQLYFDHVKQALSGEDPLLLNASLKSMSEEPGLQQLLPYFIMHVRDTVAANLKNLKQLIAAMQTVSALVMNPYFELERYLHQLLPSILTCLVGKKLCAGPEEDHWSLRDYTAEILASICGKFSYEYATLQPRITKTLSSALHDHTKPLTTHYGAVVGLTALGRNVIESLLLRFIPKYCQVLEDELKDELKDEEASSDHRAYDLCRMYCAWIATAAIYVLELPVKVSASASTGIRSQGLNDRGTIPNATRIASASSPTTKTISLTGTAGDPSSPGFSAIANGTTSISSMALTASSAIFLEKPADLFENVFDGSSNSKSFTRFVLLRSVPRISHDVLKKMSNDQKQRMREMVPGLDARVKAIASRFGDSCFPHCYQAPDSETM